MNTTLLPKNLNEAHKLLAEYFTKLQNKNKELQDKDKELQNKDTELSILKEKVKYLLKLKFAHKSEKWTKQDKGQALLFNEAESNSTSIPEQEKPPETIASKSYPKKKAGRKKLDQNLPRKEIIHALSEEERACKCGHQMQEFDRDEREELDMQPAKYWVNHHIYPQYACTHCKGQLDETTPEVKGAPNDALIPKSFASPGLLSYLFVSKFEDHLPFYRMERIFSRLGVTLPRATMCNWVIKMAQQLKPIVDSMSVDITQSKLIAADETTLQVMKEPNRKNTSKSYMWLFRGEVGERPVLLYQYHPTRSGSVASDFLQGYKGHLITDGYAGYSEVGSRSGITHVGCWAHARRKFKEAHDVQETANTKKALSLIQSLYLIEKKIREEKLGLDKIFALRQKMSKPIIEELKKFLVNLNVPPESLLGKAVRYTLNQWDKLLPFLDAPFVPIDNNRIENDIRPFVLGRKNWLFSGSPRGAGASCIIYSLIQTAKANGLDPYRYLRYLFEQLVHTKTDEEIRELAPHRINPNLISDRA